MRIVFTFMCRSYVSIYMMLVVKPLHLYLNSVLICHNAYIGHATSFLQNTMSCGLARSPKSHAQ
jgi:hypothetical protein